MRNIKQMLSLSAAKFKGVLLKPADTIILHLTAGDAITAFLFSHNSQKSCRRRLSAHRGERSAYSVTIRRLPPWFFKDVSKHLTKKMNTLASSIQSIHQCQVQEIFLRWQTGGCEETVKHRTYAKFWIHAPWPWVFRLMCSGVKLALAVAH